MKNVFAIILPMVAVLLTGCVGVMPVPPSRNEPACGKVITRDEVAFIVPGQTTRAEVVAKLGVNYRDAQPVKALAYSWETPATGWAWGILIVLPTGGIVGGNHHENSHWRAFFMEFDSGDRVRRTGFARLAARKSLDEQLENWALQRTAHPFAEFIETGGGIFNPDDGVPRMFENLKPSLADN